VRVRHAHSLHRSTGAAPSAGAVLPRIAPSARASAWVLALVFAGLAAACSKDAVVTTRDVTVNVPASCRVDGSGYATYFALGDFEPAAPPPGPYLSATGTLLPQIDPNARALVATVGQGGDAWEGVAAVPSSGDVNVLVLPADESCALTTDVRNPLGSALGAVGSSRALLAGGSLSNETPAEYVVHLDTGAVVQADPALHAKRTSATVTAFGGGGLVAGGLPLDPTTSTEQALAQAEILDVENDGFLAQTISLSEPRAGHAAVVLASGDVLLVGGYADATTRAPLASMEIVQVATATTTQSNVGRLSPVLANPAAARLANGEVLVAGQVQGQSEPATGIEWFTATAQPSTVTVQTIPATAVIALVALQGGGALAVLAPPSGAPATFQTTWVIGADHTITPGAVVPSALTAPALFGGAGGAPLLWTGDRWLEWQPWAGAFGAAPVLDSKPATVGGAFASPDPGLAMWLDPNAGRIVALRTDTTNAFSADPEPFVVDDSTGVAPDRFPGSGTVSFIGGTGLTLTYGASAFLTDRTYADVSVRATFAPGQAPDVVLRDPAGLEAVVGVTTCCAGIDASMLADPVVDVERTGSALTCAVAGGPARPCKGVTVDPVARVSVGVRGASSASPSIVQKIVVRRLGAP
jgi:hypothetical protein